MILATKATISSYGIKETVFAVEAHCVLSAIPIESLF
jgi:hypothetical protein